MSCPGFNLAGNPTGDCHVALCLTKTKQCQALAIFCTLRNFEGVTNHTNEYVCLAMTKEPMFKAGGTHRLPPANAYRARYGII